MALSTMHTLAGLVTAAGNISQITNQSIDPGIEQIIEAAGGQVDATFAAVGNIRPVFGMTTTEIVAALDIAGLDGYAIAAACDAYFQKLQAKGTRASGSNHVKLSGSTGMIIPRQLTWDANTPATLTFDVIFISSDGTTAPFAVTASQALPSFAAVTECFVTGPVTINSTTIAGVMGGTIDFGIEEVIEGGDGEVYATFIGIMNRRPTITLRTADVTVLSTFGTTGAAIDVNDAVIYLRKVAANGLRVADLTAEHIQFTVDDGRINVRPISGGQGEPLGAEIEITPVYDGTNDVVAIDTSAAIS